MLGGVVVGQVVLGEVEIGERRRGLNLLDIVAQILVILVELQHVSLRRCKRITYDDAESDDHERENGDNDKQRRHHRAGGCAASCAIDGCVLAAIGHEGRRWGRWTVDKGLFRSFSGTLCPCSFPYLLLSLTEKRGEVQ